MMKKLIALVLSCLMATSMLASCTSTPTGSSAAASTPASSQTAEKVTIKVFSNLPDRKTGQGLVEQKIIDEYMQANKNVTIEVEALDEEAYKTKFKAYAMNGMPDVVSIWGQPSFLDEVLSAGVLAELNESSYAQYGFLPGSLNGFKKDGKLYGLPRNTDVSGFYYNEKMFKDKGWKVPTTYNELIDLSKTIKAAGIVPVAMDGADGWPMAVFLSDVLFKLTGDYSGIVSNALKTGNFTDANIVKATNLLKQAADAGMFQNGYDSQDYGTAKNLFINGQAAMFYMGSWEASMAADTQIKEDIRTNIRVFSMPVVDGGKAKATDIAAWNGGGYAVAASSKVKDEAIKFLNYMYKPEKLSKYGWENGVGMSAQDESAFMTGKETELQKQFVNLVKTATKLSGTPINDLGLSAFKTSIESEIQGVSNGQKSVDQFLADIGKACK